MRTRTRSNRFFSTFYRVRDQAESYMDADSLFSRYYAKQIREGVPLFKWLLLAAAAVLLAELLLQLLIARAGARPAAPAAEKEPA